MSEEKKLLVNRLRRIEGQIRGLQRLLEEGKSCQEVLVQLAAARSALDEVGKRVIASGMKDCLENYRDDCEKAVKAAIDLFIKYSQYIK
jgi:DNA-binding FrmR family transcriptional regulator